MDNPYLTGGQLTALTILYWTNAPYQDGSPRWLINAINGLVGKELAVQNMADLTVFAITDKGKVLVEAMLAIPEPKQKWVLQ